VSLSRLAPGGDVVFGYRSAGAALGACCAIAGTLHGATTRTVGEVRVHIVPLASFHTTRVSCSNVAAWVQRVLVFEQEEQVRWSLGLAGRTAEERLLAVLAELFRKCSELQPDGSRRLLLPGTVEQLATTLRVTREHVSRAIQELVRAGVIRRDGRGCFIAPASSILLRADRL
jgi:CRP-like cAMP-binding protein